MIEQLAFGYVIGSLVTAFIYGWLDEPDEKTLAAFVVWPLLWWMAALYLVATVSAWLKSLFD